MIPSLVPAILAARLDDPSGKLVLIVMALAGDDAGASIRPTVAAIAQQTELGRRTVQGAIGRLLASGALRFASEPVAGAGRPREYIIDRDRLAELAGGKSAKSAHEPAPESADEKGADFVAALAVLRHRGIPEDRAADLIARWRKLAKDDAWLSEQIEQAHEAERVVLVITTAVAQRLGRVLRTVPPADAAA